jgi:hypothetical protein
VVVECRDGIFREVEGRLDPGGLKIRVVCALGESQGKRGWVRASASED